MDEELSTDRVVMVELLIGFRALISQRGMQPAPIIPCLDVVEQVGAGFGTSAIGTMMYQLALQGAKEALHRRVVVPGTRAIHAGDDAVGGQHGLVLTVGVLAALIRVMDESRLWPERGPG